jgi:hypothetical protein
MNAFPSYSCYIVFEGQILPAIDLEESYGNIEKHGTSLPVWVKGAAKLLNSGEENQDWLALSKYMGRCIVRVSCFVQMGRCIVLYKYLCMCVVWVSCFVQIHGHVFVWVNCFVQIHGHVFVWVSCFVQIHGHVFVWVNCFVQIHGLVRVIKYLGMFVIDSKLFCTIHRYV